MRMLRWIGRWLHYLWGSSMSLPGGIDSHKWESKTEILRTLSGRPC